MYQDNVNFYNETKDLTDVEFLEEPGGHTWDFWDRNIKRVVSEWLPVKQRLNGYTQSFIV